MSENGDTIVISDTNSDGKSCGLRVGVTLNRGGPNWPDYFIHFEETE